MECCKIGKSGEGSPHRLNVVHLVALVSTSIAAAAAPSNARDGAPSAGRVVIYLIDRSESLGKVADAVIPAITVYCENSRLAPEPTAFLAVVFNSAVEKVRVVGDDQGRPTTNVTKFLHDLPEATGPPAGVSPIDSAFEASLEAMVGLPPETEVTVVFFSDGQARHDRIRTDLYPTVLKKENDLLDPLRKKGLSPAIIEARRRGELHSAGDAEGRDLWKVQDEAQQARCIELARAFGARGVRFVSVGFEDFEALRKLHEEAGGAPKDYVVTPPGLVVDAFDKAQIGRFPMVFHDRVEAKPEPGGLVSATVSLDPIARSFVAYLEFSRSITDYDKSVELTAEFAGAIVKARQAEPDENSRVCLDSAGKACGVLFRFDGVDEQNTEMTVEFRSADGKVDMPDLILHIDMKPRDDLRPVFRPATASPKLTPPYKVEPDAPVIYELFLADEEGNHFAVAGATVTFVHDRDGEVGSSETEEVDGEDGIYRTPPVALEEGTYSGRVRFETEEGHELILEFPRQLLVARVLARIVLTYDFDAGEPGTRLSIVDRTIHHGRIGDAVDRITHTLLVSAEGIEAPMRVAVRIADLLDAEGKPIPSELVRPAQPQLTLMPGRVAKLPLTIAMNDRVDSSVADGVASFTIQFVRLEFDVPLAVEVQTHGPQLDAPDRGRFELRRARLQIITTQVKTPDASAGPSSGDLPVHRPKAIDSPVILRLPLTIRSDSELPRKCRLPSTVDLTLDGKAVPGLTMSLASPKGMEVELPPHGEVAALYEIQVPEALTALPDGPFSGTLRVSGPRLIEAAIAIEGRLARPPYGPRIRSASRWAAMGFGVLALIALIVYLRAGRVGPGHSVVLTEQPGFGGLSAELGAMNRLNVQLNDADEFQTNTRNDPAWKSARGRLALDPSTVGRSGLRIAMLNPEAVGDDDAPRFAWVLDLQQVEIEGRTVRLECELSEAEPYVAKADRAKASLVRRLVLVGLLLGLSAAAVSPQGIQALQRLHDEVISLVD